MPRRSVPAASGRFLHQLSKGLEAGGVEPLAKRVPHGEIEAKNRPGRRIGGRHVPLPVERHDRGGQVGDQGLDVTPPLVERLVRPAEIGGGSRDRLAALLELRRHLVERLHEQADLVPRRGAHPDTEVSLRDLPRRGGQLFDRPRDPAREVETDPGRHEHGRQQDQPQ